MTRSREQVQQDLGPHIDDLLGCIRQALQDYSEKYATVRHIHSKRTQANLIHDHIVYRLREKYGTLLDAEGDLAVHSGGNLNQLIFKHGLLKMRLKKFNKRLKTSNIHTQAVLDFKWQQGSFEQMPTPTNLHVGYKVTNDAAIATSEIWITCPNGERVGWTWEISALEADGATQIAEILPFKPTQRVRPKPMPESDAEVEDETSKAEGDDAGKPAE